MITIWQKWLTFKIEVVTSVIRIKAMSTLFISFCLCLETISSTTSPLPRTSLEHVIQAGARLMLLATYFYMEMCHQTTSGAARTSSVQCQRQIRGASLAVSSPTPRASSASARACLNNTHTQHQRQHALVWTKHTHNIGVSMRLSEQHTHNIDVSTCAIHCRLANTRHSVTEFSV